MTMERQIKRHLTQAVTRRATRDAADLVAALLAIDDPHAWRDCLTWAYQKHGFVIEWIPSVRAITPEEEEKKP